MTGIDPKTDLVLERTIDVPTELVWAAWTQPEHLKKWFTPRPWATVDAEIDLRPGGIFRNTMRSPEGQEFTYIACYLDVVENRRLVWTMAVQPGFRPAPYDPEALVFTAVIEMEPQGSGTKYTCIAMHRDAETADKHNTMGFHDGWGTALDQLVEAMKV